MSITLPATRVPKKLWKYLERLQEQKMFASTTELIREALREYVINHKNEIGEIEFEIIDSQLVLQKGREEDRKKEEQLLEWTETVRS
ncbi:MAG: ribbon-helix-helix domain-containing protein [Candidatus Hodarchaeales archaeon]|jgi:metal-responsive CopG/Arc/MetJ family transcriptional regulator